MTIFPINGACIPDLFFDITSPNTTLSEAANQLNWGPEIGVCVGWVGYEGLISNPKLREHLKRVAKKKEFDTKWRVICLS